MHTKKLLMLLSTTVLLDSQPTIATEIDESNTAYHYREKQTISYNKTIREINFDLICHGVHFIMKPSTDDNLCILAQGPDELLKKIELSLEWEKNEEVITDYMIFYITNELKSGYSSEPTNTSKVIFFIPEHAHTAQWKFNIDSCGNNQINVHNLRLDRFKWQGKSNKIRLESCSFSFLNLQTSPYHQTTINATNVHTKELLLELNGKSTANWLGTTEILNVTSKDNGEFTYDQTHTNITHLKKIQFWIKDHSKIKFTGKESYCSDFLKIEAQDESQISIENLVVSGRNDIKLTDSAFLNFTGSIDKLRIMAGGLSKSYIGPYLEKNIDYTPENVKKSLLAKSQRLELHHKYLAAVFDGPSISIRGNAQLILEDWVWSLNVEVNDHGQFIYQNTPPTNEIRINIKDEGRVCIRCPIKKAHVEADNKSDLILQHVIKALTYQGEPKGNDVKRLAKAPHLSVSNLASPISFIHVSGEIKKFTVSSI